MPQKLTHSHENEELAISLTDVSELSLTDVLILQLLVRYREPILRSALKESLDSLFPDRKGISSSSFYNRMNQLAKKGFLSMDGDPKKEKDPNIMITCTEKAHEAVCLISAITSMATIDWVPFIGELVAEFSKKVKLPIEGTMLIINLEQAMDVNTINMISQSATEAYIIADDDDYKSYLARNMSPDIKQARHSNGKIREAGDFFDAVTIVGYECFNEVFNVPTFDWLVEAQRVVKPGGIIVASSLEDIDDTGHFISDAAIRNITASNMVRKIGINQIKDEFVKIGLMKIDHLNYKGFLISWGYKPKV